MYRAMGYAVLAGFLAMFGGVVGCERDEAAPNVVDVDARSNQEEYLLNVRVRLDEIDRRLDKLKDKADAESKEVVAELREKRRKLEGKYDELKDASRDAWSSAKSKLAGSLRDLEDATASLRVKIEASADEDEVGTNGAPPVEE